MNITCEDGEPSKKTCNGTPMTGEKSPKRRSLSHFSHYLAHTSYWPWVWKWSVIASHALSTKASAACEVGLMLCGPSSENLRRKGVKG